MARPRRPRAPPRANAGGRLCLVLIFAATVCIWAYGLHAFLSKGDAPAAALPPAAVPAPKTLRTPKSPPRQLQPPKPDAGRRGPGDAGEVPSATKNHEARGPPEATKNPEFPDVLGPGSSFPDAWLRTPDGPEGGDNSATELVACETSKGPVTLAVHRSWAPLGAARFLALVRAGFFDTKVALFRAAKGFICQFGISGDPQVTLDWRRKGSIPDDPLWLPPGAKFRRGWWSFAGSGTNSRRTEMFVAFKDVNLGRSRWEVPFARVVDGMQTSIDRWYTGYGELQSFGGRAPLQGRLQTQGLKYAKEFPDLDYINSCKVVWSSGGAADAHGVRTNPERSAGEGAGPLVKIDGAGDDEKDRAYPAFWRPPGEVVAEGAQPPLFMDLESMVEGQPTIFIKLASYRDYQCPTTMEDALLKAKYPKRLFFGVVEQNAPEDVPCGREVRPCDEAPEQPLCDNDVRRRIRLYRMNARDATGPVTARHVGDRLYSGQHFVLQVDAHSTFAADWDVDIIAQWEATGNEMAVLSTYPTDIKGFGDRPVLDAENHSTTKTTPVMCNSQFERNGIIRHLSQPETMPPAVLNGSPLLQPFWAAGISFARGHFVVNCPYDAHLPMMFQGEEIAMTVRGFTWGYDNYSPHKSVVFHHYKRKQAPPLFWENAQQHKGEERAAVSRVLFITKLGEPKVEFTKENLHRYGLGPVRSVDTFYAAYGVDREAKEIHEGLCDFSRSATMHQKYHKKLRPDGRGIDFGALAAEVEAKGETFRHHIMGEIDGAFMRGHPRRAHERLERLAARRQDPLSV